MQVDAVLERYGPPATIELPQWIADARIGIDAAVDRLLALDEDELPLRWWWRDDRVGGAEARYAFFRAIETLESAAGAASRSVAQGGAPPAAAAAFAVATIARWDLHGLLAPLTDDTLDADPGGGEWTIRQTLAHAVNVERAYPSFSAWWLGREQTAELPAILPDEVGEGFPDEAEEGIGSLTEIRGRLDAAMDGAATRMAALDDAQLATPARWAGYAVDVGFRLWRQSSHLQEHTVQVEKTLVMLGRTPLEAERLARLLLCAYGRLEASVYGIPSSLAERGRDTVLAAVEAVNEVAEHVRRPGSVVVSGES
ncbi:MAG TPA: DinB family protein [Candidatus Limnocylindria bacterium]